MQQNKMPFASYQRVHDKSYGVTDAFNLNHLFKVAFVSFSDVNLLLFSFFTLFIGNKSLSLAHLKE